MRRAERLYRLVNEMRTRPISRAEDLATFFEVSVSTIYRDIAHLQASGTPIEGEAGVGYILRPGFDLPNMTFTHDQLDALAVGLSYVESIGDPVLASAAQEVRAMIQAGLPAPEERRLADAPYLRARGGSQADMEVGTLRCAIRERRVVRITYEDRDAAPSDRRVRPLVIWNMDDGWMFSGWCELRQDFRTFRLDRIAALTLSDDRFEDDPERGLRKFLQMVREDARGG
ncbi:helix-turn-helix transcriptional regulator [Sulfitobacter sp. JB4-11]|uniref:helix-turn-helix transcriptional regulator n=1 Tax=Sulfitobacter rhodophyticola TaxID=3238304 RepID=UPI0035153CE9